MGLAKWVSSLSDTMKALGVIGAIVSATISITILLVSFFGLPQDVEALKISDSKQDAAILLLQQTDQITADKVDKIICLLLLPDSLSALESEAACRVR